CLAAPVSSPGGRRARGGSPVHGGRHVHWRPGWFSVGPVLGGTHVDARGGFGRALLRGHVAWLNGLKPAAWCRGRVGASFPGSVGNRCFSGTGRGPAFIAAVHRGRRGRKILLEFMARRGHCLRCRLRRRGPAQTAYSVPFHRRATIRPTARILEAVAGQSARTRVE